MGRARTLIIGVAAVAVGLVMASDPPDSQVNPLTGSIESTDSFVWLGNYDVRHVIDPGDGQPLGISTLSSHPADDVSPRIHIAGGSGNTWVVWRRAGVTGSVQLRKRTRSSGTWSSELQVSDSSQDAGTADIVFDGADAWVAYGFVAEGRMSIGVVGINDDPEPFGLGSYLIGTTTYTGDLDVKVHTKGATSLYVTWVDSASEVGWSEYDYASDTWSQVLYEPYAADSVYDARTRIRSQVGN